VTLRETKLRQALSKWFSDPRGVPSARQAEARFASVYHDYAKEVEDLSGDRAANLDKSKFESALNFRKSRTAKQFCKQLDEAFVRYWSGTVFAVGSLPSPTTSCPNVGGTGVFAVETLSTVVGVASGVLYRKLLPIITPTGGSAKSQAVKMARAFDEATKSAVTVLIVGQDTTPPPTGPLPIYNVCTVF